MTSTSPVSVGVRAPSPTVGYRTPTPQLRADSALRHDFNSTVGKCGQPLVPAWTRSDCLFLPNGNCLWNGTRTDRHSNHDVFEALGLDLGMVAAIRCLQVRFDSTGRRKRLVAKRDEQMALRIRTIQEQFENAAQELGRQKESERAGQIALEVSAAEIIRRCRKEPWKPGSEKKKVAQKPTCRAEPEGLSEPAKYGKSSWRPGLQLPDITDDELWDILVHALGGIQTFLPANTFLELLIACLDGIMGGEFQELFKAWGRQKRRTLTRTRRSSLVRRTRRNSLATKNYLENLEITEARMAYLIQLRIGRSVEIRGIDELREKLANVNASDATGITANVDMRLPHFKRVLSDVRELTHVPGSVLNAEIAWHHSKLLVIPKWMCLDLINCTKGTHQLERDSIVVDVPLLSGFLHHFKHSCESSSHFSLQSMGKWVFGSCKTNMARFVREHRTMRPHREMWNKRGMPKTTRVIGDVPRYRKEVCWNILGATEFSIFVDQFWRRLPKNVNDSPMCVCLRILANAAEHQMGRRSESLCLAEPRISQARVRGSAVSTGDSNVHNANDSDDSGSDSESSESESALSDCTEESRATDDDSDDDVDEAT